MNHPSNDHGPPCFFFSAGRRRRSANQRRIDAQRVSAALTTANLHHSPVFGDPSGLLPCRRFPARRLPVFVPEEGAPRWLPPTPSSYCSGLLERGRIRRVNYCAAGRKRRRGRPLKGKKRRGFWRNRRRRKRAGISTTGLRREKPRAERAEGGGH